MKKPLEQLVIEYFQNKQNFIPPSVDKMITIPIETVKAIFGAINIEVHEKDTTEEKSNEKDSSTS